MEKQRYCLIYCTSAAVGFTQFTEVIARATDAVINKKNTKSKQN